MWLMCFSLFSLFLFFCSSTTHFPLLCPDPSCPSLSHHPSCLWTGPPPDGCADLLPLRAAHCGLLPGPPTPPAQHGLRGTTAGPRGPGGAGTMWQGHHTDSGSARGAPFRQYKCFGSWGPLNSAPPQTTSRRPQRRSLSSSWTHRHSQVWTLANVCLRVWVKVPEDINFKMKGGRWDGYSVGPCLFVWFFFLQRNTWLHHYNITSAWWNWLRIWNTHDLTNIQQTWSHLLW